MKSSICSPRTIRKFFLVGAVLLSTCTLQSTIVFATCVLQKTNPSQTRFSIKLQNATLEEFVKQVEQKTGYSFIYGEEVRLNGRITLAVRDLTINEILRKAFENQPIGFEISGKHILLNKRPVPQKTASRRFTISGYVTDGASSETLIGANILDSRQRVGTATNPFGFYSLTLPEGETELVFSYLGYESRHSRFELTKEVVTAVRNVRKQKNIPQKDPLTLRVIADENYPAEYAPVLQKMGNLSQIETTREKDPSAVGFLVKTTQYFVPMEGMIDIEAERKKLAGELEYLEGFLASVQKKLSNERFVSSAPEKVVANERTKQADAEAKIAALREQLAALK